MMKLVLIWIATGLCVVAASAAESSKFTSIPFDEASGAKPLAGLKPDDGWAAVPQGRQIYAQIPFDVVTKLQLAGNIDSKDGRLYVARSLGIRVGQRFSRIHLLHAANIPGIPNQPLAVFRLHYSNGSTQTVSVTYGVHVRNYYKEGEEDDLSDANSQIVLKIPRHRTPGSYYRIYKTSFTLRNDVVLEYIDAYSLFGKSSLAIF